MQSFRYSHFLPCQLFVQGTLSPNFLSSTREGGGFFEKRKLAAKMHLRPKWDRRLTLLVHTLWASAVLFGYFLGLSLLAESPGLVQGWAIASVSPARSESIFKSLLATLLTVAAIGLAKQPLLTLLQVASWQHERRAQRSRMPQRIFCIRHGESQGQMDATLYSRVPDSKVGLTFRGEQQARAVGEKLKELIGSETCRFFVSPYRRSRLTFKHIIEVDCFPPHFICTFPPASTLPTHSLTCTHSYRAGALACARSQYGKMQGCANKIGGTCRTLK